MKYVFLLTAVSSWCYVSPPQRSSFPDKHIGLFIIIVYVLDMRRFYTNKGRWTV